MCSERNILISQAQFTCPRKKLAVYLSINFLSFSTNSLPTRWAFWLCTIVAIASTGWPLRRMSILTRSDCWYLSRRKGKKWMSKVHKSLVFFLSPLLSPILFWNKFLYATIRVSFTKCKLFQILKAFALNKSKNPRSNQENVSKTLYT